jgi:hypothetical protein
MFGLGMPEGFVLIIFAAGVVLYFLPAIIAISNKHTKSGLIFLINLLVGWTLIGWLACLIWSFIDKEKGDIKSIVVEAQRNLSSNEKYQCRICSKTYSTLNNIRIHIKTSHKLEGSDIDKNILEL